MISEEIQILKADARGRIRVPREKRERILAEYDTSGLSAPQFAEMVGIKYPTFASWLQKRRRQSMASELTPASGNPVRWLEAVVGGTPRGKGLAVHLPQGVLIEICDPAQIDLAAALIRAVGKPC
jgi:hypothetical protein